MLTLPSFLILSGNYNASMMDGISAASAIISIISLAIQVTENAKALYDFVKSVNVDYRELREAGHLPTTDSTSIHISKRWHHNDE